MTLHFLSLNNTGGLVKSLYSSSMAFLLASPSDKYEFIGQNEGGRDIHSSPHLLARSLGMVYVSYSICNQVKERAACDIIFWRALDIWLFKFHQGLNLISWSVSHLPDLSSTAWGLAKKISTLHFHRRHDCPSGGLGIKT